MALGRSLPVSVFGRVTYPAKLYKVNENTSFLNFVVYVDNLVKDKENKSEKNTGKINCSYLVKGDPSKDMVAMILYNIYSDSAGQRTLGNSAYKSVEVLVTGNLSLTDAGNSSYYVGLDYSTVTITSDNVLKAYRALVNPQAVQQQVQPQQNTLANKAPVANMNAVQQQPQPQAQVQTPNGGVRMDVVGGNSQEREAEEAARMLSSQSRILHSETVPTSDRSIKEVISGPQEVPSFGNNSPFNN